MTKKRVRASLSCLILSFPVLAASGEVYPAFGAIQMDHSQILPNLFVAEGDAGLVFDPPTPANLVLIPDETSEFLWTFTATAPGTIVMTGSASGLGDISGVDHPSAPSPSPGKPSVTEPSGQSTGMTRSAPSSHSSP